MEKQERRTVSWGTEGRRSGSGVYGGPQGGSRSENVNLKILV